MSTKKNYNQELNKIYNFVNDYFRVDIADKNRSSHYVDLRTLFYKIATDKTYATTKDIGAVVNRDHSTVVHSKKYYFDYIMSIDEIKKAYRSYFGFAIEASEAVIPVENEEVKLTENEMAYRRLSLEDKIKYDERVSLFLKSLNWKVGISSN